MDFQLHLLDFMILNEQVKDLSEVQKFIYSNELDRDDLHDAILAIHYELKMSKAFIEFDEEMVNAYLMAIRDIVNGSTGYLIYKRKGAKTF